MSIRSCSIVGTGVAARAIAPALLAAQIEVRAIAGRDREKAARLAAEVGVNPSSIAEISASVDLVILCVSDSALPEVMTELAGGRHLNGLIVAHTSGASPVGILDPLRSRGARPGKTHPIASLAGGPRRLRGIVWGLEGDTETFAELSELIEALGGRPIDLANVDLNLYHLAAVFASNFLVGIFGEAVELWKKSGAPAPAAQALIPLARTVLANWEDVGLDAALTGPIVRGDVQAVAMQLSRVAREGRDADSLYQSLALATTRIAARRTDANQSAIAEIVSILAKTEVLN